MEFETKDADDDCTAAKMPKLLKGLSYNIESKVDKLNIFRKDEILSQRTKLERDRQIHLQNVERLNTSWNYLNGIKANYKDMKYNNDTCPICMEVLGERWAVFECCHIFCISCTVNLIGQDILTDISTLNTSLPTNNTRLKKVKCSMCRNIQKVSQIRYVSIKGDEDEEHAEDLKVTGNFSSKIHAVVKLILDLRQKDEWVKILIFSQWTIILHYVTKALEKNAITYKLHNSNNPANIDQFKNLQGSITCLLLPLKFGSKGLNLIEATHVILMEPLMNPGEEKQAISRVHRIGQTKKTFVYNFIVKNTIEEEIYKAMKSKWYHCKVNDSLCDIVADEMDSVTENNDQTVDTLSDSCVLHSESTMHESDSIMLEKIQNESGPSTAHVDTRVDITNTSSLNQSDALFDDTIDSEATMPLEGDSTIDNTISNDSDVNLSDHKHLTLRQLADLFLTVNDSFSKDIDDNELNNILTE